MTDIEEQQLLDDALNRIKRITPQIETLSEEVERLRKQNAAMREALEASNKLLRDIRLCDDDDGKVGAQISDNNDALAPDAGSTLLTRAAPDKGNASPPSGVDNRTVKCLKCGQIFSLRELHVRTPDPALLTREQVQPLVDEFARLGLALAHARTLGLL